MGIGEKPYEHINVLLDKLIEEGKLAKFRIGTNRYYAEPCVALTGHSPRASTVVTDTLKGAFINACLHLAGRDTEI